MLDTASGTENAAADRDVGVGEDDEDDAHEDEDEEDRNEDEGEDGNEDDGRMLVSSEAHGPARMAETAGRPGTVENST